MNSLKTLVLFCLTLVLVSWVSKNPKFQDTNPDLVFVRDAASGGLFEVQAGKLASAKVGNGEIKAFAQRMVKDHGKANEELKALAAKKNITLPDSTDPSNQAVYNAIAVKKGNEFEMAYVDEMVRAHDTDVAKFEEAIKSLADADIKAWASKTLPVLKTHQQHARQLQEKLAKEKSNNKDKSKSNSSKGKK